MSPYEHILDHSLLFRGLTPEETEAMLQCLQAQTRTFPKGTYVFRVGELSTLMGMLLAGSLRLEKEDYWGNRELLATINPGQVFGEVYACEPNLPFDLNVIAAQDAVVLLMDVCRVTTTCSPACDYHARFLRNLLSVMAKRAFALTRKIEHTSKRSTRGKVLSYLSDQAKCAKSHRFSIPFNRQELADYLSVDRSALSAELSKMHREGLVSYNKNWFDISGSPSTFQEKL